MDVIKTRTHTNTTHEYIFATFMYSNLTVKLVECSE